MCDFAAASGFWAAVSHVRATLFLFSIETVHAAEKLLEFREVVLTLRSLFSVRLRRGDALLFLRAWDLRS